MKKYARVLLEKTKEYGSFLTVAFLFFLFSSTCTFAVKKQDEASSAPKIQRLHRKNTPVRLAIIGDHGDTTPGVKQVARIVREDDPHHVFSLGDVRYGKKTFDQTVGPYYSGYIYPYTGEFEGSNCPYNRFWPCIGNHDFSGRRSKSTLEPFFKYFQALGNKPFYDLSIGCDGMRIVGDSQQYPLLHLFVLCSDPRFLDSRREEQEQWIIEKASTSRALWKIVIYHQPSYSSRMISPAAGRWPEEVKERNCERTIDPELLHGLGVSAVFAGHMHVYERFDQQGVPFVINGVGGESFYKFDDPSPCAESRCRYAEEHGAILMRCSPTDLSFAFCNTSGVCVDRARLSKEIQLYREAFDDSLGR